MVANPTTQYATDANLAARQQLWQAGRMEPDPDFDLYAWVLDLAGLGGGRESDVLDIGCGNGGYERALGARGHRGRLVALDLSAGMLANVPGTARVQADAQALPCAGGSFDVVLAPHMLYHVPDVAAAAAEARRVLRSGGTFLAVTNGDAHTAELRALVEQAVGTGWRMVTPSEGHFSLQNGRQALAHAFPSIERVDGPQRAIVVDDADAVAGYVSSIGDHYEDQVGVDVPWSTVVARCRALAGDVIARDGALRVTASGGAFVCRG